MTSTYNGKSFKEACSVLFLQAVQCVIGAVFARVACLTSPQPATGWQTMEWKGYGNTLWPMYMQVISPALARGCCHGSSSGVYLILQGILLKSENPQLALASRSDSATSSLCFSAIRRSFTSTTRHRRVPSLLNARGLGLESSNSRPPYTESPNMRDFLKQGAKRRIPPFQNISPLMNPKPCGSLPESFNLIPTMAACEPKS